MANGRAAVNAAFHPRDTLASCLRSWKRLGHAEGTQTISGACQPASFLGPACRACSTSQSQPDGTALVGHTRGADGA